MGRNRWLAAVIPLLAGRHVPDVFQAGAAQGMEVVMKAKSYSTSVTDDDFALPA